MKLKHFENKGDQVYELVLHGVIGKDVSGSSIAQEIAMLNSVGAKEIIERINSLGGSVVQGFSIVSANIHSKAKITTICEGVCDSIAAVIFASGDERKMLPFGSLMIHDVSLGGVTLEKMADGPDKESAKILNNSILNILESRSGKSSDDLKNLMAKETRFSSTEAVAAGFADQEVEVATKPVLADNLTREEYMNVCREFSADNGLNTNKNKNKMKNVFKFLNLSEEASEEAVLNAITEMQNKAQGVDGLQSKVTELEAKLREISTKKAEGEVQNFIDKGLFDVSKKEELVNLAIDSPETFSTITASLKPEYVNVNDSLNSKKKEGTGEKKTDDDLGKEYQRMMEEDPENLEKLELTNKSKFDEMFAAWEKL